MDENESDAPSLITILKRFGLSISTIEDSPLSMNALELENVFGTADEIIYILQEQYITRLKSNILQLVGASNVLGNPISFYNSIGTGFKDFFFKPMEGFVDGPIEGGKGLLDGTGSLVKHTTEGVFGSVAKIVGSASKGLLVLSNDTEYL